jgi:hypothetical protein
MKPQQVTFVADFETGQNLAMHSSATWKNSTNTSYEEVSHYMYAERQKTVYPIQAYRELVAVRRCSWT